ncbi:MAG: hypothetical protein EXS46_04005 [Candidatus Taylorbacteria bacterium]|nr:hypothetical protein [Candidatus Taylorbacteria bacterium]
MLAYLRYRARNPGDVELTSTKPRGVEIHAKDEDWSVRGVRRKIGQSGDCPREGLAVLGVFNTNRIKDLKALVRTVGESVLVNHGGP